MSILSPTLLEHLEQLGLKNYSDDMKIKFFDNLETLCDIFQKLSQGFKLSQTSSILSTDKHCANTST